MKVAQLHAGPDDRTALDLCGTYLERIARSIIDGRAEFDIKVTQLERGGAQWVITATTQWTPAVNDILVAGGQEEDNALPAKADQLPGRAPRK